MYAREKMAETSSGLSSASESLSNSSVSLSCESSSDATGSSVVNVLEQLKAPRLSELGRKSKMKYRASMWVSFLMELLALERLCL